MQHLFVHILQEVVHTEMSLILHKTLDSQLLLREQPSLIKSCIQRNMPCIFTELPNHNA